jgi:tRNA/tmRNA/rRNA uracil-C5-methylase (TrmA/RlmC/RlmD family)
VTTAAAAAVLPAVGAEFEVRCERLGVGGVGVCLLGASRLVLLVRGALPGETLVAKLTAVKKGG